MIIAFNFVGTHTYGLAKREEAVEKHDKGSENSRKFDMHLQEEESEYLFFVVSAEKDFDIKQISRLKEVKILGSFVLSSMFIRLRIPKSFDISVITRMQGVQDIEKEEAYKKIF